MGSLVLSFIIQSSDRSRHLDFTRDGGLGLLAHLEHVHALLGLGSCSSLVLELGASVACHGAVATAWHSTVVVDS